MALHWDHHHRAWPPEISIVEPSVERPRKIRGVMGGDGNRSSDVCSPRAARNFWFEREVAALQEKLDQDVLKNKHLSGYYFCLVIDPPPFFTESARARELAESVACMKRQAGMTDRRVSGEVAGHHGISRGDRAGTEHVFGDLYQQDRVNLRHAHGDVFHGDRANMQHAHGDVFHGDRASMQHVHGDVFHGDRASMQHVHGRVSHGDRASMQHDHGLVCSQCQVGFEHEHGDARGPASIGHEHGDVYARGQAARTEDELGDVYGPVRARKEQLLEGVCAQDPAGRQRSMSRGDRDVVEVEAITLPLLPSPEGRESSLEAGDWLIQLAPLVGDLSKHAGSWWRRVMQATTDKYSEWLYADPLARLKISALENSKISEGYERLDQRMTSLLFQSILKGCKDEVVAARELTTTGILFRIFRAFHPGGMAECSRLLEDLATASSTKTAQETVAALRLWKRKRKQSR